MGRTVPQWMVLVWLSLALCGGVTAALAQSAPQTLSVVIDDNYPPYSFREGDGKLRGIAIDRWRLWEAATGIPVRLIGLDWAKAQARIAEGGAEVIDTISITAARRGRYEFSAPYASVDIPLFFRKDVSGVSDVHSLTGVTVGVKEGSACVDWLREHGIGTLSFHPSAEAVIDAAAADGLKVFCLDKPNALYFLYRKNLDKEFRYTAPLYTAELHWAVRKGDAELFQRIAAGFDKIPADALADLDRKWMGTSLYRQEGLAAIRYGAYGALLLVAGALALFLWNATLRHRIAAGTARLTATLDLLAASNAELEARRREMAEIITGIDLAKDCITITDAEERILFTNRASLAVADLPGATLDDVRGKRVADFRRNPDFLKVALEMGAALPATEFWEGEIEWVRQDGKGAFYDVRRSRLPGGGYVVVSTDITERKRAERALVVREREAARILAAVNLTHDGLTVTDDQNRVLFANQAAIRMAGLPAEITDVRGLRWTDFQVRADYVKATTERELALETDGYWEGEVEWIRPIDGASVFLHIRHRRVSSGSVISSTDIGAYKRLEEERRQRELCQAQTGKMEALGQLAGGVAHDFNNLLGAILGFAHFIVQDTDPAIPQHHFAQRIITAGQRGRSLVQQILAFSRRGTVEVAPVAMVEIVGETRDLLRATLPSSTVLTVFNRVPDGVVLADKGQLSQVLINLCINASDALGGETGHVGIAIDRLEPGRPELAHLPVAGGRPSPAAVESWADADGATWIATGGVPDGACISVVVTDSGQGIPAELASRIFDPFFTTKEKGRGTGLGLAVTHAIVCRHGGAVLVKTRPGIGTAFEVILPAAAADALAIASEPAAPPSPQPKATVLLVDDDRDFCEMARAALERLGHEVVATADPKEALRAIEDDPDIWDLLVTDQTMPGLNGRDLVSAARAAAPELRCIICTGYSRHMNEQEALAVGAGGFLTKPIDIDEFTALVGRLLAG